jgi:ABC-type sugar transport system permease subunit
MTTSAAPDGGVAEDASPKKPRRRMTDRQQEGLAGWLMATPAMLLMLGFLIIPFTMAFGLAFTNQRLIVYSLLSTCRLIHYWMMPRVKQS